MKKEEEIQVKSWYQSKTIIGSIVAIFSLLAGSLGYTASDIQQAELSNVITTMIGSTGSILAIYGRIKSTHRIKK